MEIWLEEKFTTPNRPRKVNMASWILTPPLLSSFRLSFQSSKETKITNSRPKINGEGITERKRKTEDGREQTSIPKGEVPCIYLRLEAITPIQSEVYQTRWQENQHLLSFSNLAFSPTRRTLGSYFCRHHNVHDDIITVLAKVVHNWGHFVSKSVTLWIITGVV